MRRKSGRLYGLWVSYSGKKPSVWIVSMTEPQQQRRNVGRGDGRRMDWGVIQSLMLYGISSYGFEVGYLKEWQQALKR
ncbi:hypothetical protein PISMIDRAFT_680823 [Pisolithus microcarpus 441]|uniref:Uncharacterized protein n=1 Tax=Pisolithus microcarpus 441 TaxID=765257 RepID=A0A0C9Z7T2_9AGAM|nr:hypothetical protein PISMIDRAFT_680823 [Pisolithus microcarpus 441]